MPRPEHNRILPWAQRERGTDLAWIRENLDVLWPLARQAYDEIGRGAGRTAIDSQIGKALQERGINLEELIESGRDIRGQLLEEEYGVKAAEK